MVTSLLDLATVFFASSDFRAAKGTAEQAGRWDWALLDMFVQSFPE